MFALVNLEEGCRVEDLPAALEVTDLHRLPEVRVQVHLQVVDGGELLTTVLHATHEWFSAAVTREMSSELVR